MWRNSSFAVVHLSRSVKPQAFCSSVLSSLRFSPKRSSPLTHFISETCAVSHVFAPTVTSAESFGPSHGETRVTGKCMRLFPPRLLALQSQTAHIVPSFRLLVGKFMMRKWWGRQKSLRVLQMKEDVSKQQWAGLEAYRLQGLSLRVVEVAWEHAVTWLLGKLCQEVCQVCLGKDRWYILSIRFKP